MTDETKAVKVIEKTEAAGDSDTGDKPSAASIVERADAAAERLEKAIQAREVLLRREEELVAKQALGGYSSGPRQPEQPKEDTPKEFKDKFMKGELEFPK